MAFVGNVSEDIKKLAEVKPLEKKLQAQIDAINTRVTRLEIVARRGVAWMDDLGAISSAAGAGASGITAPQNALGSGTAGALMNGAVVAAGGGAASGGSASTAGGKSLASLGSSVVAGNVGAQSISDILYNPTKFMSENSVANGAGNAISQITGGSIGSRAVNLNIDGYFRPPDNFYTPDEPMPYSGFKQGYRWEVGAGGVGPWFATAEQAARSALATLPSAYVYTGVSGFLFSAGLWTAYGDYSDPLGVEPDVQTNLTGWPCTPGSGSDCPVDGPVQTEWTDLGYTQLAFTLGKFLTNPYDVNIPTLVSGAQSIVTLAYDGGYFTASPTANGGLVVGDSNSSGVYSGYGVIINALGNVTNVVPESMIPAFTAK